MKPELPLLALLGLAACGRAEAPAAPPAATASAPVRASEAAAAPSAEAPSAPPAAGPAASEGASEWGRPLNLLGTEPFWGGEIRARVITLSGAERPTLSASNPGASVTAKGASWRVSAQGKTLAIELTRSACSDGMSDRVYPYKAVVTLGGEVLKGCAAPAA